MRTLVWYRGKDLRISDHYPLVDALGTGEVITLFVLDPYFFSPFRAQAFPHRVQYLLESLTALRDNLRDRGGELLLASGHSVEVIPQLAATWRVDRVVAHRWSEPVGRQRDARVAAKLIVPLQLFEGETLLPPEAVLTSAGAPFSVYTPFSRAARRTLDAHAPHAAPRRIPPPPPDLARHELVSDLPSLPELGLLHHPELLRGGEAAARQRMKAFFSQVEGYADRRDLMGDEGTSRLSADLKFGTLSVREVMNQALALPSSASTERFMAQLLWREFAYHCVWHRPELLTTPFRREFCDFPWTRDAEAWRAWADGRTGYPVVDASARQLLKDGYVHNRARMISASFLTKHLLVHYAEGERHYLKYLTDGDWALNNMGWQWSAGCGVDAQPYFRVFNPVLQGQRFDPDGSYVRKYLPELAALPSKYIHSPWEAPEEVLRKAGIILGKSYPTPVVEHRFARDRFLALTKRNLRAL